jgi:hypothetical protein
MIAGAALKPILFVPDQHDTFDIASKILVVVGENESSIHPLEPILASPFFAGIKRSMRETPGAKQLIENSQA